MVRELAELAKERFEAMNSFAERFEAMETETVITCETSKEKGPRVHVHTGIVGLAAECGAKIEKFSRKSNFYPFGFQFYFDGVHFFQGSETEVPE